MQPKLTFVHGFMGDPSDWDLIRRELSDYDICTPLIRPAENWAASVEQLIADIPDRSIIVGYSMGARLSLAAVLQRPEICAGFVFVSGNPGLEDEDQRDKRYKHDCKIAARIESESREEFLNYWYTASVFESLTDKVRADEIQRKLARNGDDWAATLRTNSVAKQPNFWPRLNELTMPTLAIAGVSDRKYTDVMVRMNSAGIDTRIVPSCGHIVHHEQPHVFVKLVRDFLKRIQDQPSLESAGPTETQKLQRLLF